MKTRTRRTRFHLRDFDELTIVRTGSWLGHVSKDTEKPTAKRGSHGLVDVRCGVRKEKVDPKAGVTV